MNALTLDDVAEAAQQVLPQHAWEYLEGGVANEVTARENRAAFDRIQLNPKVLADVSHLDTAVEVFGLRLPFPILLAPAGYHKLFHSDGELETLRGAEAGEAHLMAACFSTVAYRDLAAAATRPLSFQLYFQARREHTQALVEAVVEAGCAALCVTVDVPVNGPRDRELRAGFRLPEGVKRANLTFLDEAIAHASHRPAGRNIYAAVRACNVTWSDLEWLRSITSIPLVVKGILNPQDAARVVDCGCNGIIVSNHGGRSIDTVPAAITALPHVVERVGSRVTVMMDGGIRRGTDVFKAIAFGAKAVFIGRPYLHGLAVGGAAGVVRVMDILRTELEMTMGLTGCRALAEITPERLWRY